MNIVLIDYSYNRINKQFVEGNDYRIEIKVSDPIVVQIFKEAAKEFKGEELLNNVLENINTNGIRGIVRRENGPKFGAFSTGPAGMALPSIVKYDDKGNLTCMAWYDNGKSHSLIRNVEFAGNSMISAYENMNKSKNKGYESKIQDRFIKGILGKADDGCDNHVLDKKFNKSSVDNANTFRFTFSLAETKTLARFHAQYFSPKQRETLGLNVQSARKPLYKS